MPPCEPFSAFYPQNRTNTRSDSMKKLVFAVLLVLCLVGWCGSVFAQAVSTTPNGHPSTNYATSTQVSSTPGHTVYALKACPNGINSCTCTLYDSLGTTTNQKNFAGVTAGNQEPNGDLIPTWFSTNGIYVVPSGTGCSCQVWWQ